MSVTKRENVKVGLRVFNNNESISAARVTD